MPKTKQISPQEEMALIRQQMNHFRLAPKVLSWLDTKDIYLNSVLGVADKGIPWGRMIELFGPESNGKSVLAWDVLASAQKAGANVIWFDTENSYSRKWARTRGVNTKELFLIQPYEGFFGGKKPKYDKQGRLINEPIISPAEVLCDEVRALIKRLHKKEPDRPILLVLDSVAALETALEQEAGMEGANMRTKGDLAQFLSRLMKNWTSLFRVCNVTGIFINQLRTRPGVAFGNPEYTTGGKAVKFYCHIRARIARGGGGKLQQSQTQIGIKGTITNKKNKVGGLENSKIGFKVFFDGTPSKFLKAKDIKGDEE